MGKLAEQDILQNLSFFSRSHLPVRFLFHLCSLFSDDDSKMFSTSGVTVTGPSSFIPHTTLSPSFIRRNPEN
jgi:hypothetical protein